GLSVEALGVGRCRQPVLGHGERRWRGAGGREGVRRDPGVERGFELRPEALDVERLELFVAARVRVDPLDEGGDIDLGLRLGEAGGTRRLYPDAVRAAGGLRLLAVPARRLVAAP